MYLCLCKGLTESDVRRACDGCPSADALARKLGLDDRDCCGRCVRNIDRFLSVSAASLPCQPANAHQHPA